MFRSLLHHLQGDHCVTVSKTIQLLQCCEVSCAITCKVYLVQWRTEWVVLGGFKPPPQIPKAFQNRAKLNPIVKTVKKLLNLGRQHPKMFGKKAVKF